MNKLEKCTYGVHECILHTYFVLYIYNLYCYIRRLSLLHYIATQATFILKPENLIVVLNIHAVPSLSQKWWHPFL